MMVCPTCGARLHRTEAALGGSERWACSCGWDELTNPRRSYPVAAELPVWARRKINECLDGIARDLHHAPAAQESDR